MVLGREQRARAMLAGGKPMFTPDGLRMLRRFGLAGHAPDPYVPVLASDGLGDVVGLVGVDRPRTLLVVDDTAGRYARVDMRPAGGRTGAGDGFRVGPDCRMGDLVDAMHTMLNAETETGDGFVLLPDVGVAVRATPMCSR